jgi:hypothetical protein
MASQLAGQIGRVDAFGLLSLEFTAEGSRRVKAGIETIFTEYRRDEGREFEKLIKQHELKKKLESLAEQHVGPRLIDAAKSNYRCTIYVQDLIFKDGLYQLLNYSPHEPGGAGRVMANRFGQIGRAFRAEESATDNHVTDDAEQLVAEYGMTKAEVAANAVGRRSLACVILKSDGQVVGGIYIDALEPGAFGDETAFEKKVIAGATDLGITSALADVTDHVLRTGLHLDIMRRPA